MCLEVSDNHGGLVNAVTVVPSGAGLDADTDGLFSLIDAQMQDGHATNMVDGGEFTID